VVKFYGQSEPDATGTLPRAGTVRFSTNGYMKRKRILRSTETITETEETVMLRSAAPFSSVRDLDRDGKKKDKTAGTRDFSELAKPSQANGDGSAQTGDDE